MRPVPAPIRRHWRIRVAGAVLLAMSALPVTAQVAAAQNLDTVARIPPGLALAQAMLDRMVRVVGRQVSGGEGVAGYGFIVSLHPTANGGPGLLIAVPDHVVRDPVAPASGFAPPAITFFGNLAHPVAGQLLDAHLPPNQGDLAMIVAPGQVATPFRPVAMADLRALPPGAPAWQAGRANMWEPPVEPGHFTRRLPSGWLSFNGLQPAPDAAGAAILTAQGLVGMLVSEDAAAGIPARVLPVDLMAARIRAWGLIWDFPLADAAIATRNAPASLATLTMPEGEGARLATPTPALTMPASADAAIPTIKPSAAPVENLAFAPVQLGQLAAAEIAARSSWAPAGARLSPWQTGSAPLFALPRDNSQRVGALPPGRQLPQALWQKGAYQLQSRLDGGAWFLVGAEGQSIGYVRGADVMELWPPPATNVPPTGRVLKDWVVNDDSRGKHPPRHPARCRRL